MNLDLVNDLFNNLKENKFMQNFIKELSNYLDKKLINNSEFSKRSDSWNNLLADNLEINNQKIISKYKNEMLLERTNILQNYALETKDKGEMYYIYDISSAEKNSYNLCICEPNNSHKVITEKIENLPNGSRLGSILRKKGNDFILEEEDTVAIENQINNMVNKKIKEQNQYLDSKRIDGHIYEADEKYSGRILLYDLSNKMNGNLEEIEEIEFPQTLYETAKKGDKFIYENGEYQRYE